MGFYKELLIENLFSKKKAIKSLGKSNSNICRFCGSADVKYSKLLGFGRIQGKVVHYRLICNSCGKGYFIKRTKEIFDKIKNIPWEKSKSFKNSEIIKKQYEK